MLIARCGGRRPQNGVMKGHPGRTRGFDHRSVRPGWEDAPIMLLDGKMASVFLTPRDERVARGIWPLGSECGGGPRGCGYYVLTCRPTRFTE